jgi:NAD(P)-dependent dehydrogenase (short-subunit alcohol dehydrogenase family)
MNVDVTDLAAMGKSIVATVKRFGNLDVVFANAGIASFTPLGSTSFECFDEILRVNVSSTFFLVQGCLPYLNKDASVILNSSVQNVNGRPGLSAYAASKAAVRVKARVMASELSPRGVRINVVSPGAVDTPVWDVAAANPEEKSALYNVLKKRDSFGTGWKS